MEGADQAGEQIVLPLSLTLPQMSWRQLDFLRRYAYP